MLPVMDNKPKKSNAQWPILLILVIIKIERRVNLELVLFDSDALNYHSHFANQPTLNSFKAKNPPHRSALKIDPHTEQLKINILYKIIKVKIIQCLYGNNFHYKKQEIINNNKN